MTSGEDALLTRLDAFFSSDLGRAAARPLSSKAVIAFQIEGEPLVWLMKKDGRLAVLPTAPEFEVDFTFTATRIAIDEIFALQTATMGDVAIHVTELLASSDPKRNLRVRVHAGIFDLLRRGYLAVLPLGGTQFLRYLAERGFGSIDAVVRRLRELREKK